MVTWDSLLGLDEPFFHLAIGPETDFYKMYEYYGANSKPAVISVLISGQLCSDWQGLFNEFSKALQFPKYFGWNWLAFDECINDLEWLPSEGYITYLGGIRMAVSESYKDYVLDQLEPMGYVTIKKMFGGAGIYYDGLIFGLLADDVLYFKVSDSNRPDYKKECMGPFKTFADKPMVMPYYEVPIDILEDRYRLLDWARKACIASKNNLSTGKKGKRSRSAE